MATITAMAMTAMMSALFDETLTVVLAKEVREIQADPLSPETQPQRASPPPAGQLGKESSPDRQDTTG